MRKIGVSRQSLSHALMSRKLLPVVEGERVRLVLIGRQQLHNGLPHHGRAFALYRLEQREPGLALYKRHQIALAAFTHHGIRFPVSNPGPLVHDLRTDARRYLPGYGASPADLARQRAGDRASDTVDAYADHPQRPYLRRCADRSIHD